VKPSTVFLGEMTTLEVEAFLGRSQTVLVPVGSTEQHGPHAPPTRSSRWRWRAEWPSASAPWSPRR
jgi:hypothetical protein